MNILITGAFGFVGSNLSHVLKLEQGHHLIAVDLIAPSNSVFSEFYTWSDLDKIDRSKLDVIIHLAGKAHDTSNTSDAKAYFASSDLAVCFFLNRNFQSGHLKPGLHIFSQF